MESAAPVPVLMKFIELVNANADELAELLAGARQRPSPTLGDIQRGIEVIEFAVGVPHLMKGEFTEGAGSASTCTRSASRWAWSPASPFNFPAMIPLWKAGPALACGNALILKPPSGTLGAAAAGRAVHRGRPAAGRAAGGAGRQGSRRRDPGTPRTSGRSASSAAPTSPSTSPGRCGAR